MKRFYLPAGLIAGVAFVAAVWGHYNVSPATTTYTDPAHRFSVMLPMGFKVQNFNADDGSSKSVILSGGSEGAVQITITPWPDTAALTKESAERQYLWISDLSTEPISVAGVVGLAFVGSKVPESDVWFARGGFLYQLIEDGKDTAMLRDVTAGWKFD